MPGAHIQFQYWYVSLVPLMIEMIGIPPVLTFWIYVDRYPIEFDSKY